MLTSTESVTIEAMERFGGSFVQNLAKCYLSADESNRKRLLAAFSYEFKERYGKAGELFWIVSSERDALRQEEINHPLSR